MLPHAAQMIITALVVALKDAATQFRDAITLEGRFVKKSIVKTTKSLYFRIYRHIDIYLCTKTKQTNIRLQVLYPILREVENKAELTT